VDWVGDGGGEVKQGLLFVNKKKQKNFSSIGVYGGTAPPLPQGGWTFFGSFFQKRTLPHFLADAAIIYYLN
jgi:hypothetical protein